MSKQYKKLQNKLYPKKQADDKNLKKAGKDYLLIAVFCFTIVITVAGWDKLDNMNRAMYLFLILSLGLTYTSRHAKVSDNIRAYLNSASLGAIGLAIATFVITLYYKFIG